MLINYERILIKYTRFAITHPLKTLGIYMFLTLISLWGTLDLGLSTSLSELLPQDTPSVRAVKQASKRVGSTDSLIIAIQTTNPQLGVKSVDLISKELRISMPDLSEIISRVDLKFFKKNAMLYFSKEDLSKIDKQLKKIVGRLKLQSMGLIDLPKPDPEQERLKELIKIAGKDAFKRVVPIQLSRGKAKTSFKSNVPKGYLVSRDGKVFAIVARPKGRSVNMAYAQNLVKRAEKIINKTLDTLGNPKGLKIEVGGGYRNRVKEYESVKKDATSSFGLSFLLMALIAILYFRSAKPLLVIFPPLVVSILWTLGLARLSGVTHLNLITVFIGAILLGMGIDYGVHLTSRFMEESGFYDSIEEALIKTMVPTTRALITAAITTSAALYLMYLSSFRGFWEFGLLAGTGILITLLAYVLMFPPIAVIINLKVIGRIREFKDIMPSNHLTLLMFLSIVVTILISGALWLPYLSFESNMRNLSGKPSTKIKYGKAVGDTASPTVVLCEHKQECKKLTKTLEKRFFTDLPDPDLKGFLSPYSFIPKEQDKKIEIIRSIKKRLKKAKKWQGNDKTFTKYFKYLPNKAISDKDLPKWVRTRFMEKDGSFGKFLYIYSARDTWDSEQAHKFKTSFNPQEMGAANAMVASSSFILVDVLDAALGDGLKIFILALLLVFLVVLIDLRSLKGAFIVLFSLVGGLILGAGLLPWLGQKLGIYNMVVVSTVVGTGIDSAVHLYHSLTEKGVYFSRALFRTAPAVIVASITTMAGFGTMIFVHHGGLSSIGRFAIIGIGATLLVSLCFIPVSVHLFIKSNNIK